MYGFATGVNGNIIPTTSRLKEHSFTGRQGFHLPLPEQTMLAEAGYGDDDEDETAMKPRRDTRFGSSSGENMLKAIEEIVDHTNEGIYLFDEWDANLDAGNRAKADQLVNKLAMRAPSNRDLAPRSGFPLKRHE